MAETNLNPAAEWPRKQSNALPEITVEAYDWGHYLVGTREALAAHPDVPAGMFDGEGEKWKASRTIRLEGGRKASIQRIGRRYRFCLHLSNEEFALVCARRRYAEALRKAHAQIAAMPTTAKGYLKRLDESVYWAFQLPLNFAKKGAYGFRLADDALSKIEDLVDDIREVVEEAATVAVPGQRETAINSAMAEARKLDPKFGALLDSLKRVEHS